MIGSPSFEVIDESGPIMRFNKIIRVWLIPPVADTSAAPLPGADKGRRDKSAPTVAWGSFDNNEFIHPGIWAV